MPSTNKVLPPPKGLYAHIRENNFRSLALFAWFVILLELLYVATSVIFISCGVPIDSFLRAAMGDQSFDLKVQSSLHGNSDELLQYVPKNAFEVWDRFWDLDAAFGSIGLIILLLAALYVCLGLWFNTAFARRQAGAIRVRRQDEPRLYALVEPMAIARGLPMPKLEVVPSPALNAYAGGMSPATSVIGVTRGLMNTLTDAELEAVLAHEFAHIENRDNRLMTLATLCADVITRNSRQTFEHMREKPVETVIGFGLAFMIARWEGLVFGYAAIVLAYFLADSIKHLISQKREFIADARAIEMVKEPGALISALYKISKNDKVEALNPGLQAMMISNVSGTDAWTHPSVEDRIAAISATTNILLADALAQQSARSLAAKDTSKWSSRQPTFGTRRKTPAADGRAARAVQTVPTTDPEPRAAFGKRRAASAAQSTRRIDRNPSYGADEQWTLQERHAEAVMEQLQTAQDKTSSVANDVRHGFDSVARWLFLLPFILVAFAWLPTFLTVILVTLAIGVICFRFDRQRRLARVVEDQVHS